MTEFYAKVNKLLEEYIGGQIFFTELDNAVKFDKEILAKLITYTRQLFPKENILTIASGEIGLAMHNFGYGSSIDLLVPGGLRHDPTKINLEPFKNMIVGQRVVFIDDSYFSGRTLAVIKIEVEKYGGKLVAACVAYDGSKEKDINVYSLYRYYDHHDILGRPLNEEVC